MKSDARFLRRKIVLTAGAIVAAAAVGAITLLYLSYIDWPARPAPLPQELRQVVGGREDLIQNIYVYDFWSNFIDSQHLWRIEAAAELIPMLAERLELHEVQSSADVPQSFWSQPPYWWKPRKASGGRFFTSPLFVADERGRDGNHYFVMHDEQEGLIYAWAKYNF